MKIIAIVLYCQPFRGNKYITLFRNLSHNPFSLIADLGNLTNIFLVRQNQQFISRQTIINATYCTGGRFTKHL